MAIPTNIAVAITANYQSLNATALRMRCVLVARSSNAAAITVKTPNGGECVLAAGQPMPYLDEAVDVSTIQAKGTVGDYLDVWGRVREPATT